ncbi:MAG: aminotransferase class I/II-fold pyridoxal phosphate-dependent enzyme [Tindallia sp. MSAO_Bac2]|nr:MAG: aminotransferase class I/II-fold pyridoxal phosphate-dependent enzyme [Tindallia sp. MSAO_Bac2]
MEHGGNIIKFSMEKGYKPFEILDYSSNISPLGVPEKLWDILSEANNWLSVYPDPDYNALRTALTVYSGADTEKIVPGNGAAQIIHDTIRFINPNKTMLVVPTFSEYEKALKTTNSQVEYFLNHQENGFTTCHFSLMELLDETYDLLILCNPNNPTGSVITREVMLQVLKHCSRIGCHVMIDEAFMDFLINENLYSVMPLINDWNNLIVVRAFTKIFGIPGLRLGYGVYGNINIAEEYRQKMIPWSVNVYAEALKGFINSKDAFNYIFRVKEMVRAEKNQMYNEIMQMEAFRVFPSEANFLLIKIEEPTRFSVGELWNKLMEKKILVRDCSNFRGMPEGFFRIAIKKETENQCLIDSLKSINNAILYGRQR